MVMRFAGCCTYPLGGYVTAGLFLACAGAFTATFYAVSSCRFLTLTFTSKGNFEETFSVYTSVSSSATEATYTVGIGLFQWLRSITDNDWTEGACAGYQQSMLDVLSDSVFNVARAGAVFAVMLSFVITCWVFLTACLDMNRIQICLLAACCFFGCVCCGMTFAFQQTSVCIGGEEQLQDSSCDLDEGALVMIAACIFWFVAFLITVFYVRPSEWIDSRKFAADAVDHELLRQEILRRRRAKAAAAAAAEAANASPPRPRTLPKNYSFDSQKDWTEPIPSRSKDTVLTIDDVSHKEQLEVYVSKKLDRITNLAKV